MKSLEKSPGESQSETAAAIPSLAAALKAGYESLAAWADLLDAINVYPVADGDTGANLRVSLAPLREFAAAPEETEKSVEQLARGATGNSGNIAAAFFSEFCSEFCSSLNADNLAQRAAQGRDMAYRAVAEPKAGTMLTFFDTLAETLSGAALRRETLPSITEKLAAAVTQTAKTLPELADAGVVDSGALGMYLFFDGFFRGYLGLPAAQPDIMQRFADTLTMQQAPAPKTTETHCIGAVLTTDLSREEAGERLAALSDNLGGNLGSSVVILPEKDSIKLHIHTSAPQQLREELQGLGEISEWAQEEIIQSEIAPQNNTAIHIVTDAAASLTRQMAKEHGITLLDSYIISGSTSRPETLCNPQQIYALLQQGQHVTTAQASVYERQSHYASLCAQYPKVLYLCVGSAFTGNFATAQAWQHENDTDNALTIIDTGAASGRLALIALQTARFANSASEGLSATKVIEMAQKLTNSCRECVFIDELKYLAAGGRISKAKGFFGDLFRVKPIIEPTSEGVKRLGTAKNREEQLTFAQKTLTATFTTDDSPLLLLQYSDNEGWLREIAEECFQKSFPKAEILCVPLSLTSGVHMGPGTWSLAFAPQIKTEL